MIHPRQAFSNSHHDRPEVVKTRCTNPMNPAHSRPHAWLAARIVRSRTETRAGEVTREIVYLVTILGWSDIPQPGLATLARGHWAIENKVPLDPSSISPDSPMHAGPPR